VTRVGIDDLVKVLPSRRDRPTTEFLRALRATPPGVKLKVAMAPRADLCRTYAIRIANAEREGRDVIGGASLLKSLAKVDADQIAVVASQTPSMTTVLFLAADLSGVVGAIAVGRQRSAAVSTSG